MFPLQFELTGVVTLPFGLGVHDIHAGWAVFAGSDLADALLTALAWDDLVGLRLGHDATQSSDKQSSVSLMVASACMDPFDADPNA